MNAILNKTQAAPSGSSFVEWMGTLTADTVLFGNTAPVQITFSSIRGILSMQVGFQYGALSGTPGQAVATASDPLGITFFLTYAQIEAGCPAGVSQLITVTASVAVFFIEPNSMSTFTSPLTIDLCQAIQSTNCDNATVPLVMSTSLSSIQIFDMNLTSAKLNLIGNYSCSPV